MTRISLAALFALSIALFATGCGGDSKSSDTKSTTTNTTTTTSTSTNPSGASKEIVGKLVVSVSKNGNATIDNTLTFECPPDHFAKQEVRDLCRTLEKDPTILTATPPDPSGGECPASDVSKATATIIGDVNGAPLNQKYSRANSCEIDRWNAIEPLILATGYVS